VSAQSRVECGDFQASSQPRHRATVRCCMHNHYFRCVFGATRLISWRPNSPDWDGCLAGLPGRSFARFWSFSIAARPCALAAASLLVCVVQAGRLCFFASFGRLEAKQVARTAAPPAAGLTTGPHARKQRVLPSGKTPEGVLQVVTPKNRVLPLVLGTARASRKTEPASARTALWATTATAAVSGESCWLPRNRYLK